nr:GTPase-activating protein CdGAPr isoform X2 [Halyomorpha halys]
MIDVGSVRLKSLVSIGNVQCSTSRFPKLEECAHFHYDHVDLQPIQLKLLEEDSVKGEFEGITLKVTSGHEAWQIRRTYDHFCKLDEQLHQCVFDRKFSELPVLSRMTPKNDAEIKKVLNSYVKRLSYIGSGCAISCGPALSWFELDNRGRRIVAAGQGINTPAVAAAFATTPYTAHATDELSFQIGDMISVIDMPPAEESVWWRGKRGFVVGFFPSNCVAVITDKIPNEIALAEPSKPVLRKHGKLIAFFRAFILSRPSRRRLKQTGILKERVFGCDLSEHLLNSGRDIPLVLKCCSEFIEAHGIVDGIYRLSGVTSNIQRLRSIFDEDRLPTLVEDTVIKQDIHSVASLLKMYFRELPNPLCTYQLYDEFVAAVQSSVDRRIENMRKVVRKLPPPHYRTLKYLMGHLGHVCSHSSGTGMTARNVAIVWAPNLLRCRSLDQGVAALQGVGIQAVVTEFLILNSPEIFGTHDISEARPKSVAISTPTKLLTLEEAQARGQTSRIAQGEMKEQICIIEKMPCYHTVIDLPRKRPALNWKTIFTPRRSHQVKSPRRFKRKTVIKSAEYLTGSGTNGSSQQVNNSTHSRSVSHDSYFDMATAEHPSTSSLVDTQHEGLSLSLDLSELQMNFDVEESEMRIFSEDETNQLFSSGISLIESDNLEQRFSSQELRYIDSYSPEPDSPSETSPRYQPLLTPSSYENLRTTNNNCDGAPSSQRTSASYAYEKLAESPVLGEHFENYDNESCEEVKQENDLYEGCYEEMELGVEGYEPVSPVPAYENQRSVNQTDNSIYEDVQLTTSEIYQQVSYLRNSVEELNRFVLDSNQGKDSSLTMDKETEEKSEKSDRNDVLTESPVYHKINDSLESVDETVTAVVSIEHSPSSVPIEQESLENLTNQVKVVKCSLSDKCVPDWGDNDKLLESDSATKYENVEFTIKEDIYKDKNVGNTNDNNPDLNECNSETSAQFLQDNCDTKLSISISGIIDDNESLNKDEVIMPKVSCCVVSEVLKQDWIDRTKDVQFTTTEEFQDSDKKTEKLQKNFDKELVGCKWESNSGIKSEESDVERRERIERYKEERRTFFRKKYGADSVNNNDEADEELIRRIKQRTQRGGSGEKWCTDVRSPTKTTVSISYSPARVSASKQLSLPSSPEKNEKNDSS